MPVDLRTGQHLKDEFRVINPQMLVPALEADGQVMIQSPAIIAWLDEGYPAPALLPSDRGERAHGSLCLSDFAGGKRAPLQGGPDTVSANQGR